MESDQKSEANACDLCKVNYATENELEDHYWSLMHHIKAEKLKKLVYSDRKEREKKGAPHSCNLCMESCANIIEYGKHLNEDRHKLALSRRGKEASEMLDSFSGSSSLFGKDNTEKTMEVNPGNRDLEDRSSRHGRSFSQPEYFQQDMMLDPHHSGPSSFGGGGEFYQPGNWSRFSKLGQNQPDMRFRGQGQIGEGQGQFKVPRSRSGHFRTRSDVRHDFNAAPGHNYGGQHRDFYADDYNINWNDNNFFSFQHNQPPHWNNEGGGRYDRGHRRGSFDSSFHRNNDFYRQEDHNWDGSDRQEKPERGRALSRDGREQKRSTSYDNISPESTSSSDSGLKRRREQDESVVPGKSRRRIEPLDFLFTIPSLLDKDIQKPRSRSSSKDNMLRDSGYGRSETDSESRFSSRKVTWSDQQVSSSTERGDLRGKGPGNKKQTDTKSNKIVLPDSSSESEGKKKNLAKSKSKKKSLSPRSMPGGKGAVPKSVAGDLTESVLEKAEKLCKKLRSDREKAKNRKREDEKSKKLEKEIELNKKIETLSEMNKTHIKGVLDTGMPVISAKSSLSHLDGSIVPSSSESISSIETSHVRTAGYSSPVPKLAGEKPFHLQRLTPTHQEIGNSHVADRIAQTKADIDHIRAKIEASVNHNTSHSGSSTEVATPPKYPQATDRTSLVKMVNSPRTTKERLSLAQMLREHARSQTKLSLPRFNLKYSDLCSGSDKHDEYTNINVESLAPNVQLQIANLIEADVKPNISELERLLDQASEGNAELDAHILSELGIDSSNKSPFTSSNIPSTDIFTEDLDRRQPSHERSRSPIRTGSPSRLLPLTSDFPYHEITETEKSTRANVQSPVHNISSNSEKHNMPPPRSLWTRSDQMPGSEHVGERDMPPPRRILNIDDLRTEKNRSPTQRVTGSKAQTTNRFSSSVPSSTAGRASPALPSQKPTTHGVTIKQEKVDDGYDQALGYRDSGVRAGSVDSLTGGTEEQGPEVPRYGAGSTNPGQFSPVRRSIHTQNLYRDDLPVRDGGRDPHSMKGQGDSKSALEKVSKILDAVPAPDCETKGDNSTQHPTSTLTNTGICDLDKPLDSSVNSQASILDEVYRVSLREENVRNDINTVDVKINKLKFLIEEASDQLRKCAHEKQQLIEQEKTCRTKRLQLLEESRSSSGCSGTGAGSSSMMLANMPAQFSDNPLFLKFLMSQRQSDLSSVGGYSNVESGSQPDVERTSERRGSLTSNITEPVSAAEESSSVPKNSGLFSKSLDVLTGSTETMTSAQSQGFGTVNRDSSSTTPKTSTEFHENSNIVNNVPECKETINSTNSISFLNSPLDKVGFVTLEALMKGDTDIGKLLHKSLESIEKGTVPEGASPLQKQVSNGSQNSVLSGELQPKGIRERRDSSFSISSDGYSDSEKRKVSMKYMGTLPEGINYEAFVKQMSEENKNKSLMFTVFSSPEATNQLRRTPDAGLQTPANQRPTEQIPAMDVGYKSDTNSNRTLTDVNDVESHSARSTFSLGEQIKRMCDGQNTSSAFDQRLEIQTPRSGTDTLEELTPRATGLDTIHDGGIKLHGVSLAKYRNSPVKECSVMLEDCTKNPNSPDVNSVLRLDSPKTIAQDAMSPTRKKLKSKKERDQMSRRKQKESFILMSDTNSDGETAGASASRNLKLSSPLNTRSEEELVHTGSEDVTPRPPVERYELKRSLLDEVQLETETPSDSCEDRSQRSTSTVRENVKSIQYEGPGVSVVALQEFNGDLYVCYNGSELRRFDLKSGKVLKELDCSPYLVNCLHVTNVEERGDVLYTGGTCRKLMAFEPQKFNLLESMNYTSRLTCLHENWGRLFVGLADGTVSARSLKNDKELNSMSVTASPIHCLASTSAGMTKMLCLATGDKVMYVVDAITGLLITMLEGHTQPPLYIQICGEKVLSGGIDQTLMVHSVTTGDLLRMNQCKTPFSHIYYHDNCIYCVSRDRYIRTFDMDLKTGVTLDLKRIATCSLVADNMLIVGSRNGTTEAFSLNKNTFSCQFGQCSLEFSKFDQLKLHVLSEHVNNSMTNCDFRGCTHTFQASSRRQNHILSHVK